MLYILVEVIQNASKKVSSCFILVTRILFQWLVKCLE